MALWKHGLVLAYVATFAFGMRPSEFELSAEARKNRAAAQLRLPVDTPESENSGKDGIVNNSLATQEATGQGSQAVATAAQQGESKLAQTTTTSSVTSSATTAAQSTTAPTTAATTAGAATTVAESPTSAAATVQQNASVLPEIFHPALLISASTTSSEVETRLTQAIERRDITALKRRLDMLGAVLRKNAKFFDVSQPFACVGATVEDPAAKSEATNEKKKEGEGKKCMTLLAAAAATGWTEGMKELLDWDKAHRNDAGGAESFPLESDGQGSTPLMHAARNGSAPSVRLLLNYKASVFGGVRSEQNQNSLLQTPLEAAAAGGHSEVAEELLMPGLGLEQGLVPLRARLAKASEHLPAALERWPVGPASGDGMAQIRDEIPTALRPPLMQLNTTDFKHIGNKPANWVLWYMNRVMCQVAGGISVAAAPAGGSVNRTSSFQATAKLLAAHGYDAFLKDFAISSVIIGCVAIAICGLMYAGFRLRVYGCQAASVSFADVLPGACDPTRFVDPDFDPNRLRTKLPYRLMRERIANSRWCVVTFVTAFCAALAGVFNSWIFLCVRIPPEKDIYDEDYASDDDDLSRKHMRELCAARARLVRGIELLLRNLVLATVLWWFGIRAKRLDVVVLIAGAYGFHALVAACIAASTIPADSENDASQGHVDAANLVFSLFAPQYGPRWARAVCTTRSTAAPSRNKLQKRNKRPGKDRSAGRESEDGLWDEALCSDKEEGAADGAEAGQQRPQKSAFFGSFQRSFLQVGLMHSSHGDFLARAVYSLGAISTALLWLTHLSALSGLSVDPYAQYREHSATELFKVYGAPWTMRRACALFFETLALGLVMERMVCIANCLNVGNLCLVQRRLALSFASAHLPAKGHDGERRVLEADKCLLLTTELSSLRWSVLRSALAIVTIVVSGLLVLSTMMNLVLLRFGGELTPATVLGGGLYSLSRVFAPPSAPWWQRIPCSPAAVFWLALCFFWPLMMTLIEGARSNRDLHAYIARVAPTGSGERQSRGSIGAESASSNSTTDGSDGETGWRTRALSCGRRAASERLKGSSLLQRHAISWPGGKELGLLEPLMLSLLGMSSVASMIYNTALAAQATA